MSRNPERDGLNLTYQVVAIIQNISEDRGFEFQQTRCFFFFFNIFRFSDEAHGSELEVPQ
jgi:hypothetical protein